jgi:hypothetical protein
MRPVTRNVTPIEFPIHLGRRARPATKSRRAHRYGQSSLGSPVILTGLRVSHRPPEKSFTALGTRMSGHSLSELAFQKADCQNAPVEPLGRRRSETAAMKQIRAYLLESEANLARIALEGVDIPAVVVGVGIGVKGGALLVPEDRVDAALKVLEDLEDSH